MHKIIGFFLDDPAIGNVHVQVTFEQEEGQLLIDGPFRFPRMIILGENEIRRIAENDAGLRKNQVFQMLFVGREQRDFQGDLLTVHQFKVFFDPAF